MSKFCYILLVADVCKAGDNTDTGKKMWVNLKKKRKINKFRGFIKGRALGKLTSCEVDFACLV